MVKKSSALDFEKGVSMNRIADEFCKIGVRNFNLKKKNPKRKQIN